MAGRAHPIGRMVAAIVAVLGITPGAMGLAGEAPPARDLTLWYGQPAKNWMTEALPIGNGRLGAMLFGGTATERVQFN